MYFLTILETGSPRSRCWQGWLLLRLLPLVAGGCFFTMSSQCVLISFFKNTSQIGLRTILKALFQFHHLFKGPIFKYCLGFWGLGLQHRDFWGMRFCLWQLLFHIRKESPVKNFWSSLTREEGSGRGRWTTWFPPHESMGGQHKGLHLTHEMQRSWFLQDSESGFGVLLDPEL